MFQTTFKICAILVLFSAKQVSAGEWPSFSVAYSAAFNWADNLQVSYIPAENDQISYTALNFVPPVQISQSSLEFSYRFQIRSWFTVQPLVQHILTAARSDGDSKSAWLVGTRFQIKF